MHPKFPPDSHDRIFRESLHHKALGRREAELAHAGEVSEREEIGHSKGG
jgi:hypothetical protein